MAKVFRRWRRRLGLGQRFGASGKFGSIAVVEPFIRTLKNEGTRAILVPPRQETFERELAVYFARYDAARRPLFEPRRQ